MKKRVFLTCLTKDEALARDVMALVTGHGLDCAGNFWIDDLDKMQWAGAAPELTRPDVSLWILAGALADFAAPSIRKGLSLLALMLLAERGHGFPILACATDGLVDPSGLPTPLRSAEAARKDNLGAKVAVKANLPWKPEPAPYRLRPIPLTGVGLWLEVGPSEGQWKGVLTGAAGAEIDAQGVGPAGKVPQRAVLEYPVRGMTLSLGQTEYTAWGAANLLTPETSHYVRIKGAPSALLFGEMPSEDAADLFSLNLA